MHLVELIRRRLAHVIDNEQGQSMVEYALILVLIAVVVIVVLILRAVWPMPIVAATTVWLGLAFVVIGLAIMATGRRTMTAAGTNVNPSRPATTIVSSGPFRFTRNPLYVGVTLIFGGLTLAFNTWWGFIVLVPVLPWVTVTLLGEADRV